MVPFFFLVTHMDLLWAPPTVLFNRYQGYIGWGIKADHAHSI